ncbi:sulfotransferase domain-containing protein [Thalassotalea litorea]|uniref:sulfotransferase domain-containing protein n=1 Tax=Thalassotalea litorea TaxID=2020715 RepID=UPI0037350289
MKNTPSPQGRLSRLFDKKHQQIRFKYRLLTAKSRVLPDFLILGARYSGTASLIKLINEHPKLHGTCQSQIHYFDGGLFPEKDNFSKGEHWYRAHFPMRKEMPNGHQAFEASTFYSFHPLAAKRLHSLIPKVKIIFVLRNPVDRAIHHYLDSKRHNREYLPFINALQIEEKRLAWTLKNKDYKSGTFIHATYKSRGHYQEQIERYLKLFPKEQIKLVSIEELKRAPNKVLLDVYRFLGVENIDMRIDSIHLPQAELEQEPEVRSYLKNYFSKRNQAFYEFSGKSFNW